MAEEPAVNVGEELIVQLVECAPTEEPQNEPLPTPIEDASPVRQGFKAEIAQVGAEPPPMEMTRG